MVWELLTFCRSYGFFGSRKNVTFEQGWSDVTTLLWGINQKVTTWRSWFIVKKWLVKFSPITRWWFQHIFMFTPIWGNEPIWPIFFKRVENTSKIYASLLLACAFAKLRDHYKEQLEMGCVMCPNKHLPSSKLLVRWLARKSTQF